MARKPGTERSVSPGAWALLICTTITLGSGGCGGEDTSLHTVRPLMVLDPDPGTTLRFPEVVLTRSQDNPQIITVQNVGEGPLTLDRVVIQGDAASAFVVSSRPRVVLPGGKGQIFIRFEPSVKIQANATFHMETNDRRLPVVEYPLASTARDPCVLQVTPPNQSFIIGETKAITLSALGTQDCTITYLFTDQDLFPFVDPPALPFVVPAGTSKDLMVRQSMTGVLPGTPVRSITVKESEGTEATVSVIGEAPLFDCLSVYPFRVLFDTTPVGTMQRQKVTVSNSCDRDAYITSGETTLGYYYYSLDHSAFPLKVPAQGAVEVWVEYSPFSRGGDDGVIVFNTNDTGAPTLKVTLFGRAAVPVVAIFPSVLDFGSVAFRTTSSAETRSECSSATTYVQVYSDGDAPLTIASLDFEGDADFEVTDVIVAGHPVANIHQPFQIPASQDAKIYLQFYPSRLTPPDHQAALVIHHDADGSPFRVTLKGHAVNDGATTDTFQQLSGPKVDILFVIDDSCSMANKQALLIGNLSHFVGYADAQGADYNIAVVNTEGFSPLSGMFQRPACDPNPRVINSHWADSMTRAAAFQCMFSLGTVGSGIEAGLASAKNALIKAQDPTMDPLGWNQGFLRWDAKLAIVVVSDADDQSHESQPLLRDYFLSIKGPHRHNDVKVHAVAGPVDEPCPAGAGQVESTGYNYYWMTQQTGGKFFNICLRDWTPILTNLGLNVFQPISTWDLSQQADPGTLIVRVNGVPVPLNSASGYSYDGTTNSVHFNGASVPSPGATVTVNYSGLCRP